MAAHHTSSYTYLLEKNYQSLSCQWHIKTFHALTREHATYTARPLTHFAGAQHNWVFICKTRPTPNLICTQHFYFENMGLFLTVWKRRVATWKNFGKSEKEPGYILPLKKIQGCRTWYFLQGSSLKKLKCCRLDGCLTWMGFCVFIINKNLN